MGWSEDGIHRWLLRAEPRGLAGGAGHDAAVLRALSGRPVVCTDQTIEGVHYASATPARAVGRKAAGRVLSDLAATAATPRALFAALAAPAERSERWVRGVLAGVRERAREHGADLAGGDLSATDGPATLAVTGVGELPGSGRPPWRGAARAGERVVVTGPLGGSALGRHLGFEPRLAAGRWLWERGARALMDVSDGLAWDLFRLARTAGVGIELDAAAIPVHADARRLARRERRAAGRARGAAAAELDAAALGHALHDGEDHELVATLSRAALARVLAERARRCPALRVIGRVVRGRGVVLVAPDGARRRWEPGEGGYRHGG